jgi:DNA-binding NarL/FixJ family response regulator
MAERILIADDSDIARCHLREILEDHPGWEICAEVGNGQEALSKSAELKPDLIILDLAMPIMDGLRAAHEILKVLPTVPIVIYTLHASPEIELEARRSGVRRTLSKAEDTESLIRTIEALLDHEQPGAVSGATGRSFTAAASASQPEKK